MLIRLIILGGKCVLEKGGQIVKKRFIFITLIIISLCIFTSCIKQQNKIEVYSFSGEDESISINNGLIIVTDDLEKFIGGDLSFKGEEPSDIKDYFEKFFFYKSGDKHTILSNVITVEGTVTGHSISSELGSTSSENLFYGNNLDLIKESLNFSLNGELMSGEKFEYNLVLDMQKVY